MSSWYLVMCKPYKDASVEIQLNNQGFETYRPLISKEKKIKGKVKQVKESLFPRYIFIQLKVGVDDWSSIRSTRGVFKIVSFGNNPTKVPDGVISTLKNYEDICLESTVGLKPFKLGDKIRIESGPFAGMDALFDRYKKSDERVIVLLNILNNIASLNLPAGEVKKVA